MDIKPKGKIGEFFQEYTKYQYFFSPSDMSKGLPLPEPQQPFPTDAKLINLPDVKQILPKRTKNFFELVRNRRSLRKYLNKPITLKELTILLWATQGVTEYSYGYSLRTVPSAGARHPFETYLSINNVKNLESGLYRYLPFDDKLLPLKLDNKIPKYLTQACLNQEMFEQCAVTFIWCAIIQRCRWKYQQRAYRYIYLDAGHVCQNLYLACEAMGLGCCAIAAFDDDAVNKIIDVDGLEEFAIYLANVGKIERE
ncbi:MAG: SagB/ThcOx family dehydrogenase [bacterium]|nr:MAG: SagB/ThcOx family dehydrogenase [bacterium]